MSESRLVALARQAQNLQPERRTNTLSELRGRWSDYVNPYQTPPQQLSDLANPLRWPAMAVEGIQTAVETVPRMLQPGYDYSNTRHAAEDAFNVAGVVGAGSLLGTAAKPANAVGTFGGKLGGAAGDLDMSQAARLARAKEMGFGDEVYYHGTVTGREIDEFGLKDRRGNNLPTWFAPESAREFSNGFATGDQGRIYPVKIKQEKLLDTRNPEHRSAYEEIATSMGVETDRWYAKNDAGEYLLPGWGNERLLDAMRDAGWDGVVVQERPGFTSVAVYEPTAIRSVNAAFDPAKSDSANLLASRGAPVPVEQRRRRDKDEIF